MTVLDELARLHSDNPTVVTVGMFDGVHRGHQYLVGRLKETAARMGCASAIITFTNHPRTVMRPDSRIPLLNTPEDRLRLLSEQGVDLVVPLSFTMEFSYLRAREFVEVLINSLNMKGLVIGPDFAFGYRREGTAEVLTALGEELGFSVEVVQPVAFDDLVVSSTEVRKCVEAGDMTHAAEMLGRPFTISGFVIEGDRRGRTIGFPTANIAVEPGCIVPAHGVYATWTQADGALDSRRRTSGCGPPSAGAVGRSRRTCWTMRATSTTPSCGWPSRGSCGTRSGSAAWTRWWRSSTGTSPQPARRWRRTAHCCRGDGRGSALIPTFHLRKNGLRCGVLGAREHAGCGDSPAPNRHCRRLLLLE